MNRAIALEVGADAIVHQSSNTPVPSSATPTATWSGVFYFNKLMKKNTVWASFAFEPFDFVHDDFEFNPLHIPRIGEGVYMFKYNLMLKKHYDMPAHIFEKLDSIFVVSDVNWEDLEEGIVHINLRPLDYLQKPLDSPAWTGLQWQDWLTSNRGNNTPLP